MAPGEPTPCYKILDCWWEVFDVTSYLKDSVPEGAFKGLFEDRRRPDRLNTILELIEKYKKTVSNITNIYLKPAACSQI